MVTKNSRFTVFVDGGCLNNHIKGTTRLAYGSIRKVAGVVSNPARIVRKKSAQDTFELPEASTAPEAEFNALIVALEQMKALHDQGIVADIVVKGDSKLVMGSIAGIDPKWLINPEHVAPMKIRADNLVPLFERVKRLMIELNQLGVYLKFNWVPKEVIEEAVGH